MNPAEKLLASTHTEDLSGMIIAFQETQKRLKLNERRRTYVCNTLEEARKSFPSLGKSFDLAKAYVTRLITGDEHSTYCSPVCVWLRNKLGDPLLPLGMREIEKFWEMEELYIRDYRIRWIDHMIATIRAEIDKRPNTA